MSKANKGNKYDNSKKKKSWDTASSWVKKIEQIKDTNWSVQLMANWKMEMDVSDMQ